MLNAMCPGITVSFQTAPGDPALPSPGFWVRAWQHEHYTVEKFYSEGHQIAGFVT